MPGENEIISKIRQGDIKSFETLFRSYYISLVRYAGTLIKDKNTAEEIVQELFTKIWDERENLKIKSSVPGYLFKSVHNRCLHHIEHLKVVKKHLEEINTDSDISYNNTDNEVNFRDLQETIAEVIERLPEKCGKIFCMNRFEGLKYQEIAEKMGISVKTVESCMGKALKEFRKTFTEKQK
ncbi:MAG TPA: RNA polymerase sigma-70 factor [Bacteroidales bacterium]|nr:RNA polymerase sigma-70 factor [Bacteroidales bacterium]HOU95477.1 RNA polymerase sigma-70 factor [Bacteroidales bacterium]HQG36268.1 RNA polymerase sigma-70 factor [Bacteroidales bacterium]HQG52240.1 RNA polymerase sigma-70 factor [Bacteroidales bacterium]HQJ19876.1 RNA polymerase sigma-70 factor [Bacteroidales bacterium]